ncbi:UbiA family prenyltransferase, partial [Granulosicoccus sp.]
MANTLPLCVDLDGTLIKCDSLYESFLKALKHAPLKTMASLRLLSNGKAAFKDQIAQLAVIDASTLPYNQDVLDYVKEQRADREVVLVTGANIRIAAAVNDHLKMFDSVIASDETNNLIGDRKRLALVERYGEGGFDYIGNEAADFDVWKSAKNASLVTADANFAELVQSRFSTDRIFMIESPTVSTWLKFARIHQWSKNLLLLVPFFLDHRSSEWSDLATVALCFIAFSLLASMTYMVNDMLDIESDRQNSTKLKRAVASGEIQVPQAAAAVVAL